MTPQLHRMAANAFAENHIGQLAADVLLWRTSKPGLPTTSQLHKLARLCAVYALDGDEYQEAERLVALKALEAVARIGQLTSQVADYKSLLDRLHPHVRGCDSNLWDEYLAALKR